MPAPPITEQTPTCHHCGHRLPWEVDEATGCWNWTGAIGNNGYGVWSYLNRQTSSHRAMWQRIKGPLPPGIELHHLCRNRACVNLDHLQPLSIKDHKSLPRPNAVNQNSDKTHCVHGHPFDEQNTRLKKKKLGGFERVCKTCARENEAKRKALLPRIGRQQKTHCPYGHEYTEDNVFLTSSGGRACRECRRVRGRERNAGGPGIGSFERNKTHCKHGHPFSGDNFYVDAHNKRICRACNREKYHRRNS